MRRHADGARRLDTAQTELAATEAKTAALQSDLAAQRAAMVREREEAESALRAKIDELAAALVAERKAR